MTLREGIDYEISYTDNINAGTATVTISGIGNFTGNEQNTFEIIAKSITPFVILSETSYKYDGKAKAPTVVVKDGKTLLKKDRDYSVSYSSGRTDVGRYKVTIKLKGNYSGSNTSEFRICFKDVPMTHSFHKAVYWAADEKITTGYSGARAGLFGVNDDITRGQVVTFLWKIAGNPAPRKNTQTFKDVPTTHSFYKAIQWAVEQGIASGYSSGNFGPNDNCTRGQIATFLWKYAGKKAPAKNTQTFSDVPTTHSFYKAVQWAVEQGITSGFADGSFGVTRTCTRGQCVTFLYKMQS